MAEIPNAALWARAKEVVADAIELPSEARDAFVLQRCADDAALLREVRSLLTYSGETSSFSASFSDGPLEMLRDAANLGSAGTRDRTGEVLGAWRLEREIGRGGMGVVFLSHRADGAYQQAAAVKVLRGGTSDPRSVARMQRERQTLAQLTHPNIARLIDGGNAADGTPYLVMEYVEGESIDRYCEKKHLSIEARIGLMVAVCAAVQSAHQRLVIHRDLKPSNVLVTSDGAPKLLDFGVARLLEAQGNETDQTQGALLFTPRYASPEQVRGLPVNVATDVYGLGLLLYELLAGESPYEQLSSNSATNAAAAMQAVVGDELRKPSEVARQHRPGNVEVLRGDLDTILLRACAKDANERYATVADLSGDLTRYIAHLPILALPPTWSYLATKFVRRNAVGVGLGSVACLAVIAGFTGTVMQKNRAEAERAKAEARYDQVRNLATRMVTEYNDAIVKLPGGTELRQRMANDAIKQLDTLARDAPSDPALSLQIAQAYQKLAAVSYSETRSHLGDGKALDASLKKADALITKALEAAKSEPASEIKGRTAVASAAPAQPQPQPLTPAPTPALTSSGSPQAKSDLKAETQATKSADAKVESNLGSGGGAGANAIAAASLSATASPVTEPKKDLKRELELQWGDTRKSMAGRARATGEYDKAQQLWEGVVKHFQALAIESPTDEQYGFYMLDSYYSLSQLAMVHQRRTARPYLDAAKAVTTSWLKLSPEKKYVDYFAIRDARTEYQQAKFDRNTDLAISHIDREIKVHEARSKNEPANTEWVRDYAQAINEKAGYLMTQNRFAEALAGQEAALALVKPLYKADPADVIAQTLVMWVTRDHGIVLANLDRKSEAAQEFETAYRMCAPMTDTDKTSLTVVRVCINVAWWTTKSRVAFERREEAKESARRVLAMRDKFPKMFDNKLEQQWLKNAEEAIAGEPLTAANFGPRAALPYGPTTEAAADGVAKKALPKTGN